MNITDIYEKYKIMPQLQMHMLRVAGVASIICDNFYDSIDKNSILQACLLHDMGNIIKFDLNVFPEHVAEKGLYYWELVKSKFIRKYGTDDHQATIKILNELNIPKEASNLVNGFGFGKGQTINSSDNFSLKICVYSDMRTSPLGVTSLKVRLRDAKKRYVYKKNSGYTPISFDKIATYWFKTEKQIFSRCGIKPEDITDEKVQSLIKNLKIFEIQAV